MQEPVSRKIWIELYEQCLSTLCPTQDNPTPIVQGRHARATYNPISQHTPDIPSAIFSLYPSHQKLQTSPFY